MKKIITLTLLLFQLSLAFGQTLPNMDLGTEDNDLSVDGDIFSDFNEDIESSQVMEDERYYRYGRFFSFQVGLGTTWFDGNRGAAYEPDPPAYTLSFNYFLDFNSSFGIGFAFSKHWMFFPDPTIGSVLNSLKFVDISLFRTFFSYRYYIETANLGTAITWSNPYFTGRLEYWYETQRFPDVSDEPTTTGGGLGMALGFGLEFPVKIRESYINVEFLYHTVNFQNKFTAKFQSVNGGYGFDDLTGAVYTNTVSYVFNW